VVRELFGWLSLNTDIPKKRGSFVECWSDDEEGSENNEDGDVESIDIFAKNQKTVSHSTMQGYKSALIWLYKEKKSNLMKNVTFGLTSLLKDIKR